MKAKGKGIHSVTGDVGQNRPGFKNGCEQTNEQMKNVSSDLWLLIPFAKYPRGNADISGCSLPKFWFSLMSVLIHGFMQMRLLP